MISNQTLIQIPLILSFLGSYFYILGTVYNQTQWQKKSKQITLLDGFFAAGVPTLLPFGGGLYIASLFKELFLPYYLPISLFGILGILILNLFLLLQVKKIPNMRRLSQDNPFYENILIPISFLIHLFLGVSSAFTTLSLLTNLFFSITFTFLYVFLKGFYRHRVKLKVNTDETTYTGYFVGKQAHFLGLLQYPKNPDIIYLNYDIITKVKVVGSTEDNIRME